MLDYETYCKIRDHFDRQGLTITQTARALGLHPQTVSKWVRIEQYRPRRAAAPRKTLLDPYKGLIVRWLDAHLLSAQQVLQRLREAGFAGCRTIVSDYVRKIRPRRAPAFLRLSFFVMVLCYSRLMYVEFTVSQTMEHFLACHENAWAAFGGVASRVMIDSLKSAVLQRLAGTVPVFNARHLQPRRASLGKAHSAVRAWVRSPFRNAKNAQQLITPKPWAVADQTRGSDAPASTRRAFPGLGW
jgi:transposase